MDVGNKTLSQLSDEAKEKRYVTLDVGAKVSGYTKEYLERLCRLDKVEYRLWNNGQFVIELESLLRETHTILLSYEDIIFVEKSELAPEAPHVVGVAPLEEKIYTKEEHAFAAAKEASALFSQKTTEGITQSVPTFGEANRAASAFSFVGRAVESDPLHPSLPEEKNIRIPIVRSTPPPLSAEVESVPPKPKSAPMHLLVTKEDMTPPPLATVPPTLLVATPALHPIQTALDATVHHDPAPLFSFSEKIPSVKVPTPPVSESPLSHPAIPDLGLGARVVVFSPARSVPVATPAVLAVPAAQTAYTPPPVHPKVALLFPSASPPLPSPEVRPSLLPAIESEHHLTIREERPLTKSLAFNVAFAACLVVSLFSLATQFPTSLLGKPVTYMAAVVSARGEGTTLSQDQDKKASPQPPPATEEMDTLPFSDDVRIADGADEDSVIIAPIFDGVEGEHVEYVITRKASTGTTSSVQ